MPEHVRLIKLIDFLAVDTCFVHFDFEQIMSAVVICEFLTGRDVSSNSKVPIERTCVRPNGMRTWYSVLACCGPLDELIH